MPGLSRGGVGPSEPGRQREVALVTMGCLLLGLLAVSPMLWRGPSCGHDFDFHLGSWIDAASQLRHGVPYPQWDGSAAWNAGEPRFVFYPPLSWLLGAMLLLLLPAQMAPPAFTAVCLGGAALAMYRLGRRYAPPRSAALAAALYALNPYLLFTAWERTAYGELLAACFMPLLLKGLLESPVTPAGVALPLGLLWLSNAPAGVMGTYLVVAVALGRALLAARIAPWREWVRVLLAPTAGGLGLGLALAGTYLVPAVLDRRFVSVSMAVIPELSVDNNTLFAHTGDPAHDAVLRTASVVAVVLLGLTAVALGLASLPKRLPLTGKPESHPDDKTEPSAPRAPLLWLLGSGAMAILLLQLRWSLPIWHGVPELAFLQFPWRLLAVLGCVFGLLAALALGRSPSRPWQFAVLGTVLVLGAGPVAEHAFRQGCEAAEQPQTRQQLFRASHGDAPTDEYTPAEAENDQMRFDDPGWWLADTPDEPAPGTVPNPLAASPDLDYAPPESETISSPTPRALVVRTGRPRYLILNLRRYPAWQVTRNGEALRPLPRRDGLLAFRLPAGESHLAVTWRRLPEVWVGDALSLGALLVLPWLAYRKRRRHVYLT